MSKAGGLSKKELAEAGKRKLEEFRKKKQEKITKQPEPGTSLSANAAQASSASAATAIPATAPAEASQQQAAPQQSTAAAPPAPAAALPTLVTPAAASGQDGLGAEATSSAARAAAAGAAAAALEAALFGGAALSALSALPAAQQAADGAGHQHAGGWGPGPATSYPGTGSSPPAAAAPTSMPLQDQAAARSGIGVSPQLVAVIPGGNGSSQQAALPPQQSAVVPAAAGAATTAVSLADVPHHPGAPASPATQQGSPAADNVADNAAGPAFVQRSSWLSLFGARGSPQQSGGGRPAPQQQQHQQGEHPQEQQQQQQDSCNSLQLYSSNRSRQQSLPGVSSLLPQAAAAVVPSPSNLGRPPMPWMPGGTPSSTDGIVAGTAAALLSHPAAETTKQPWVPGTAPVNAEFASELLSSSKSADVVNGELINTRDAALEVRQSPSRGEGGSMAAEAAAAAAITTSGLPNTAVPRIKVAPGYSSLSDSYLSGPTTAVAPNQPSCNTLGGAVAGFSDRAGANSPPKQHGAHSLAVQPAGLGSPCHAESAPAAAAAAASSVGRGAAARQAEANSYHLVANTGYTRLADSYLGSANPTSSASNKLPAAQGDLGLQQGELQQQTPPPLQQQQQQQSSIIQQQQQQQEQFENQQHPVLSLLPNGKLSRPASTGSFSSLTAAVASAAAPGPTGWPAAEGLGPESNGLQLHKHHLAQSSYPAVGHAVPSVTGVIAAGVGDGDGSGHSGSLPGSGPASTIGGIATGTGNMALIQAHAETSQRSAANLKLLQQHIDELTGEKLDLMRGLQQQVKATEALAEENRVLGDQYNSLLANLDTEQRRAKQFDKEMAAAAASLAALMAERDAHKTAAQEAVQRANSLAAENVALDNQLLELKSISIHAEKEHSGAAAIISKLGAQVAQLTSTAKQQGQELSGLQAERRILKARLMQAEARLRAAGLQPLPPMPAAMGAADIGAVKVDAEVQVASADLGQLPTQRYPLPTGTSAPHPEVLAVAGKTLAAAVEQQRQMHPVILHQQAAAVLAGVADWLPRDALAAAQAAAAAAEAAASAAIADTINGMVGAAQSMTGAAADAANIPAKFEESAAAAPSSQAAIAAAAAVLVGGDVCREEARLAGSIVDLAAQLEERWGPLLEQLEHARARNEELQQVADDLQDQLTDMQQQALLQQQQSYQQQQQLGQPQQQQKHLQQQHYPQVEQLQQQQPVGYANGPLTQQIDHEISQGNWNQPADVAHNQQQQQQQHRPLQQSHLRQQQQQRPSQEDKIRLAQPTGTAGVEADNIYTHAPVAVATPAAAHQELADNVAEHLGQGANASRAGSAVDTSMPSAVSSAYGVDDSTATSDPSTGRSWFGVFGSRNSKRHVTKSALV